MTDPTEHLSYLPLLIIVRYVYKIQMLNRKTGDAGELIKESTSTEELKCDVCSFTTASSSTLKHHMASRHGIGKHWHWPGMDVVTRALE